MATHPHQPTRRRRWLRLALALVAVGLAGWIFYLTRPATLASIILPRATRAIGGEVTASRISLGGINSIVLEDLRVRAPGWDGIAGEVVYADRIEIRFGLLPLLVGELRVRSVQAGRVELRLAESADELGSFSVLALDPAPPKDPDARSPARPGDISINELVLENGLVARDGYRKLGDLRFRGSLTPSEESASAFRFALSGRPDAEGRLSIASISGSFDGETQAMSIALEDLSIDGRQLAVAPIAVRTWTSRLGLEGRIPRASLDYAPGREPSALIDLEGVAMNLPVDELSGDALEDAWGGFSGGKAVDLKATPRMTLRSGTLRLERNEVRFERISGELGADDPSGRVLAVPFTGEFSLRLPAEALPAFEWDRKDEWFEQAARIAPFSIRLAINDFASPEPREGAPDTLQLPRAATKVLSDFNITRWTIDVETLLERGAPAADGTPAPLRSSGTLVLDQGSGAFEEFPYRLDGVSAVFRFGDDNLVVERLTGTGAEGATASITGRLDGLSTGAEIDLRIVCEDAPIDERLFNSFEDAPREALGLLFDARAAALLGESGLLPDANAIVAQRQELSRLGDDEAVKATRERLERSIAAGPFTLGGRCGFDMRVYSPPGFGQPVIVTGDVRIRDAGLVFGRFPYPLRLKDGGVRVLDEAIEIAGDGIRATTPAGGELTVSGSVGIPRIPGRERGLRPLITITDRNDALNPALLAAIPHAGDEMPAGWPGAELAPAGELLASLGLSGRVELDGLVDSDDEGRERFRFKVDFEDGTAAPDDAGRAELAESGLPWPPEFKLEDCAATIQLTPERVVIERCTGRNGGGTIEATGFAELEGPNRLVELTLNALPIGRAFEGYLAGDPAEAAARFARYGPSGAIDGTVRREVTAAGAETRGTITPRFIELTLDGSRVRGERIAGGVTVRSEGLRADSLEFRLSEGSQDDGILRLSGVLSGEIARDASEAAADAAPGAAPGAAPDAAAAATTVDAPLEASLSGTRIESPLVRELLATRAKGVLELLNARAAKGLFDARYVGGGGDGTTPPGTDGANGTAVDARGTTPAPRERFEIRPRTLGIGQPGERVEFTFAETDLIAGDGDRVTFDVHGTLVGDHAGSLQAAGSYESGGDNRLNASMRLEARELTTALRKHLPPPLDTSAEAVNLTTTQLFELVLPDVALRWPANGSAAAPDVYQMRGTARLSGAAFDAGTRYSEIYGELPLRFRYEPRAAKPVDFSGTLQALGARVWDRPLGATRIQIDTGAAGDSLVIAGSGDVAFGRFDLATTVDFTKDTYDARVRVADADYEVLRTGMPLADDTPRTASRLSGTVQIAGSTTGSVDSRTGSGRVAIRNASLASMPVAMRVLQLTQLMLPGSGTISASDAEFTIRGNTAEVTRCELAAGTIQLSGKGTMDIPTFGIGVRLFPRGTLPIVSDVIGGVTNQIFAIDLSGTLSDPKASVAALPGITDMPSPPPTDATAPGTAPATTPATTPAAPTNTPAAPATTPAAPATTPAAPTNTPPATPTPAGTPAGTPPAEAPTPKPAAPPAETPK